MDLAMMTVVDQLADRPNILEAALAFHAAASAEGVPLDLTIEGTEACIYIQRGARVEALLTFYGEPPAPLWVQFAYVVPDARRLGRLSTMLFQAAELALRHGCRGMEIATSVANGPMNAALVKLGLAPAWTIYAADLGTLERALDARGAA